MSKFLVNKTSWLVIFVFFIVESLLSQNINACWHIKKNEKDSVFYNQFSDTLKLIQFQKKMVNRFTKSGYAYNVLDSVYKKSDTVYIFLFSSNAYQAIVFKEVKTDKSRQNLSFYPKIGKVYKMEEFDHITDKILSYWENNGFPFVSLEFTEAVYKNDGLIEAVLTINKNFPIKIDSVKIIGNSNVNKNFIYNYSGIKPGMLYNESKLKSSFKRIKELSFIQIPKEPQLIFTRKYTKAEFYINSKKSNQFDGILGFLPDNQTGKVLFTGQAHIRLLNSLGAAELIEADWRKLQANTSDLKLNFNYPYLLNSPLGLDYMFNLYRKDTTFTDLKNNFGVQYLLSAANFIKVFYAVRTSNLISSRGYEFVTTLPEFADVSVRSYGLGIRFDFTDYRFNPRKGLRLVSNFQAGNKEIRKNPAINEKAYENIRLKSTQFSGDFLFEYYIPVVKNNIILTSFRGAFIESENLFFNELFRLGGLGNLRGFDDESIFASRYAIATLEYRFLLDRNSNFFIFGSGAYRENTSVNNRIFDRPYSFGTGINFETKAGIFNLTYALGRQLNNPLLLRAAKIHFGIVSIF